jgi:hypothetical protein
MKLRACVCAFSDLRSCCGLQEEIDIKISKTYYIHIIIHIYWRAHEKDQYHAQR